MTCDVGPNDLLEAVRDAAGPMGLGHISKGRIYVCIVVGLFEGTCRSCGGVDCKNVAVMVREAPLPYGGAWCRGLFRPINKGDPAALARSLLGTAPAEFEEAVRRVVAEPEPMVAA